MKLRGDWITDEETLAEPRLLPAGVLAAAVRRVHEAGGRVAIHAMHEVACRRAVEAGVDSLEHGLWLAHDLLPRMAAQSTALVPTYTPWAGQMKQIRALRLSHPRASRGAGDVLDLGFVGSGLDAQIGHSPVHVAVELRLASTRCGELTSPNDTFRADTNEAIWHPGTGNRI